MSSEPIHVLSPSPVLSAARGFGLSLDSALKRLDGAFSPAVQVAGVVVLVAASLALAAVLFSAFSMTRLSMVFLGAVILSALAFGTRASVFAAFLSFLAYNFTLTEPRFTFQFAGAEDVLTLTIFLVVALTTGALAGRVRESQRRERERADDLSLLLDASQAHARTDDPTLILRQLRDRLCQVAGGDAWVVDGAVVQTDAEEDVARLVEGARGSARLQRSGVWRARRIERTPGGAVAVWRTDGESRLETATEDRLGELLVDLAAVSLDRTRLGEARAKVEADRQTGALREAVLASLSHDLRTPLASILASASSLRDFEDRFDADTRRGLSEGIVHEADRLNRYVENLLNLTRIQAGSLRPALEPVGLSEVLEQALGRVERERPLAVSGAQGLDGLVVLADPLLLEQALFNILDNAVTHGGSDVHLAVMATERAGRVELVIEDDGPGVPGEEAEHLFEKFFQSASSRRDRKGAGVGLAVTRGFVDAMGGAISAGARRDGASGLRLGLSLRAGV